jgi:RNA polymerase sigma-70 factor (ECF subfamily)
LSAEGHTGTLDKTVSADKDNSVRVVELVVRHRRMIQAYAYVIVRDHHLAEDIYQDVAVVVAKREDALPPDDQIVPWLKEVTRRKSLETLRKSKRMPPTLSEDMLALLAERFEPQSAQEEAKRLRELRSELIRKCVDKLTGTAGKVVRIRYGSETATSCEQIARLLGRSVKAVYNVMGRARLALAKCVEQEMRLVSES